MLKKIEVLYLFILTTLVPQASCGNMVAVMKFNEAFALSTQTVRTFLQMFLVCAESSMPSQNFLMDDLKSFVNYPSKTTVGFAPKFTSNRKFFANMIATKAFKEMLARDEEAVRKDFIKKLKYCDQVALDKNMIKDLYDREVDHGKI